MIQKSDDDASTSAALSSKTARSSLPVTYHENKKVNYVTTVRISSASTETQDWNSTFINISEVEKIDNRMSSNVLRTTKES